MKQLKFFVVAIFFAITFLGLGSYSSNILNGDNSIVIMLLALWSFLFGIVFSVISILALIKTAAPIGEILFNHCKYISSQSVSFMKDKCGGYGQNKKGSLGTTTVRIPFVLIYHNVTTDYCMCQSHIVNRPFRQITFTYDLHKDVENIVRAAQSVNNPAPTRLWRATRSLQRVIDVAVTSSCDD